ncbi:DUF262 domain-containing protein [Enterococcus mundtii]|uniref:DUF262 domain-containing protein n=1 Tax=Enterococcus mundtii TaxID=53346 RepID=UPI001896F694|nr:DUF262 domain-containing protein [Enterococcus mundtii]MDB7100128.1 DUF262 domain-containing protein [Enterococcus mundtii]
MEKMSVFLNVKNNIIVEIADIETEKHNVSLQIDSIDDFYHQIQQYETEETLNIDDFFKEFFDDEKNSTDSLSEYKIKHWVSNRSFGELIDMYENREIIVPNMQRNFVWDSIKCSRLIESIILGLPIPPLFLLEISDNKYELIDGFQRLTTLSNFVLGRQWNYNESKQTKVVPAKLSKKVAVEIAGLTFSNLDKVFQTKIKRSTIPLIEFKQLDPINFDSKYLIFERINTGSVKLNAMQIRKSLSYGEFIEALYYNIENMEEINQIFSPTNIKNDNHIEAILRIKCFYSFYYENSFNPESKGIKNILNEYCEVNKNSDIDEYFFEILKSSINILTKTFSKEEIFKRIEIGEGLEPRFVGNLNVSILESLTSAVMYYLTQSKEIDTKILKMKYKEEMIKVAHKGIKEGINPFSISTGSLESINARFSIAQNIVAGSLKNDI